VCYTYTHGLHQQPFAGDSSAADVAAGELCRHMDCMVLGCQRLMLCGCCPLQANREAPTIRFTSARNEVSEAAASTAALVDGFTPNTGGAVA
jgi:hypothetical protein